MGLLSLSLAGCPGPEGGTDTGGVDAGLADVPGLDAPGLDAPALPPDAPRADTGPVTCTETGYPTLDLAPFVSGLDNPVYVTQAPGSEDFFIVDQGGVIQIADSTGTLLPDAFLDITRSVAFEGGMDERGLLGLAFHPDYATNGLFYVYYTEVAGRQDQVVARGRRASARDAEDTVEVILRMPDQAGNHNGGCLQFGPDGELYIATGDGGDAGDPENDAQNTENLLGKILRIHVDAATPTYSIPASNPFAAGAGADEIYAYGLRNPWRFSFDRATGDLYIGDVGQGDWEEIDVSNFGTGAGTNFGWRTCEGFEGYSGGGATGSPCSLDDHDPVLVVGHGSDPVLTAGALAITGGYVYRGSAIPALTGAYIFADAYTREVGAFRYCDGAMTEYQELTDLSGLCNVPASFGEDNAGELYVVCRNGGTIERIVAR